MANLTIVPTATKTLSPSQQEAFNHLMEALPIGNLFVVWSGSGMGRTTILNELHRQEGGELLRMKDYIDELRHQDPFTMEEAFEQIIMRSLQRNDLVILDDLDLVYGVVCGCGYNDSYPRAKYLEAILTNVLGSCVFPEGDRDNSQQQAEVYGSRRKEQNEEFNAGSIRVSTQGKGFRWRR